MREPKLHILYWLICLHFTGWSQMPYLRSHIPEDQSLWSACNVVFQSSEGFMLVGTKEGLYRYDGTRFELIAFQDTAGGLRDITAIYETAEGVLWAGCRNGNLYFGNIHSKLKKWHPEEGTPVVPITSIAEDRQKRLWFSTYGEGIYFYRDKRLYNIDTDDGLPGKEIYKMILAPDGKLWAGTDNGISICTLEKGLKKVKNITRKEGLPDDIVRDLAVGPSGTVWAGMYDSGICSIDPKSLIVQHMTPGWTSGIVNCIVFTDNSELWVGTDGDDIVAIPLRPSGQSQTHMIRLESHIKGAKIFDLHKDPEGNIWIVSNKNGIQSANLRFRFFNHPPPGTQAIVYYDQTLWTGTAQGLFRAAYTAQDSLLFKNMLPGKNIISLYSDHLGNLWIGTFGDGVYCYKASSGAIRHLTEADGLTNGSVLSIGGKLNTVWLATLGGVTEIQCEGDILQGGRLTYRNYNHDSGLGSNYIYKVLVDSRGRVWFATDGKGISVLDKGRLTNFPNAGKTSLKVVYSIAEDKKGNIWFSTDKEGVFRFDGKAFKHFGFKEGVRDLSITGIAPDALGNIILIHKKGLDVLDPESGHIIYFDKESGINNLDPNLNVFCQDDQQGLWIGADNQIILLPAVSSHLRIHPFTCLQTVSAFLEPVDFKNVHTFGYNQNYITFGYVGLWYTDPGAVTYRYQLEGFDRAWKTSKDREAVYPNLPPGTYTFRLQSSENGSFEHVPEVSYQFVIKNPVWKRLWFLLLVSVIAAILFYWIITSREKRIQNESQRNKEMIESQFQSLRAQINPHFLFNSFNTLITIIEENPALAVEYVENLSDFYRSLLQYRETELISISEEIELVRRYYFLLQKRYDKNLILHIDVPANGGKVAPLTLQMLVENAVKHNIISTAKPLVIDIIKTDDNYLLVQNTLQPKLAPEISTKVGLHNIINRYKLLSNREVAIERTSTHFVVRIPLLS